MYVLETREPSWSNLSQTFVDTLPLQKWCHGLTFGLLSTYCQMRCGTVLDQRVGVALELVEDECKAAAAEGQEQECDDILQLNFRN